MEVVTSEVYENVEELRSSLPTAGRKIIIKNEEEIIKTILDKIRLLVCNSDKPNYNAFYLSLEDSDRIVLFNWLKNNNRLDELVTYNLWHTGNNYIYL